MLELQELLDKYEGFVLQYHDVLAQKDALELEIKAAVIEAGTTAKGKLFVTAAYIAGGEYESIDSNSLKAAAEEDPSLRRFIVTKSRKPSASIRVRKTDKAAALAAISAVKE